MEFYKSKYSDKKSEKSSRRENEPSRSFRNSRDDRGSRDDSRTESTTVTCSDCGNECQVPFVPRTNKPVYCSDCFRQHKPDDSGSDRYSRDDRGSRYSRDDRGSRYSRDDRGSRYSRDDRGSRYSRDDRGSRYSRDDRGSRYSRDDRGSRDDSRTESTTVTCSDCGNECQVPFVPRTNKPVYCSDCFRQHKPDDLGSDRYSRDDRGSRYSRDDRGSRYSRDDRGSRDDSRTESTTVTCSDCGNECQVPFVPRTNKPVYCSDCFRQHKPDDSGSDRYSRDDRGSKSSYGRESSRDNSRSRKPRNDKFLRKQESFYSNGSDKFYETVKEKLYEILGGKTCSSCGFKDERALGISPISDNASDSSGRGGDAASWGKYISAPELAREELKVFCLNCNEIREPVSKPAQDRSKSKKSKYFPR